MDTLVFILKILGSLGVFLYGMKVMSEGLQRTAGDGMRKVMATMTHNRLTAILTGLLVTSVVQSSSATTVMVVSFVNAGLLTLIESIGVIMGANLGTTMTAWIIALVGKFSLADVAIPIIGIGLPLFFIGRNRGKHIGEVLIGFGLLFFGLNLLKDSVPDVKSMLTSTDAAVQAQAQQIQHFVSTASGHGFVSILLFLCLGIILTLVVQSSSAAMAITVTLAIQGWIGFHESAAIVLGENIGTTVTAWLASIGTSANAKRAARAHFLFNVIGVCWMLVIFYAFSQFVVWLSGHLPETFRTKNHNAEIGFQLAIFHSLFNFTNILLLAGFTTQIAKLVTRLVKEPSSRFRPLNEVWLETRVISAISCAASASSEARSLALLVLLADWMASSRMRCRLLPTSARAPSAVCASEMPSLALRAAWLRPRICAVIRSEMARPAASSLAVLMRRPEERRCSDVASADCELLRLRCAFNDEMLVLIT